ncbi:hypothetical protein H0G69_06370 [Limosilactobacillus mucosae]|uniref:hypothetical protein n=1 Tax=Limosilactobacillus mucosae TaxID=97478 RepID=UPI0015D56B16|nr:hypothetical protein [Limosilactobacillus mucosae]QLI94573.1 hypothetical protein H0G69_06370 [Limosilactobacillus mucosae]
MALTQLTPVENWTKIINDNFGKTDLANLNWHRVNFACTVLNGATLVANDLFYANIGQAKLCLLEISGLKISNLTQGAEYFSVPTNYAPSHVVSASLDQCSYTAETSFGGGNTFQVWSTNNAIGYGNASMVWLHVDGGL